jgi:hypothetical protein
VTPVVTEHDVAPSFLRHRAVFWRWLSVGMDSSYPPSVKAW